MARIAPVFDPVGLLAQPAPFLCFSAIVQIRDNPSSIKNKNLQAPDHANTKSSRDPGRESTRKINLCLSVSIRVHPCPILTMNPIAPPRSCIAPKLLDTPSALKSDALR